MIPIDLLKNALEITEAIKGASSILITSHARPDGDAIGSVAGLFKALRSHGTQKLEVALLDGVPSRFDFAWPQGIELVNGTEIEWNHDLLVVLDCGDETRMGISFKKANEQGKIINIDHHSSNNYFGDLNYVDVSASSTCEVVTALLDMGKLPMDSDVGLSLMLGLITDSRNFQNEGLRSTAHLAAAKLLELGTDTTPIQASLNNSKNEKDLRMLGFGLSNFKLEANEKLASLVITQEDLDRLDARVNNIFASGIFNSMLGVKTVLASVVAYPKEDGSAACEFRARSGVDVKTVAVALGGGGHLQASGCNKNVPLEQLAQEAIALTKKQLED